MAFSSHLVLLTHTTFSQSLRITHLPKTSSGTGGSIFLIGSLAIIKRSERTESLFSFPNECR